MRNVFLWRTLSVVTAATLAMGLSSCSGDSDSEPKLEVQPPSLSFEVNADSKSASITSNAKWTIATSQTWITVSPSEGSGNATIYVNAEENQNYGDKRTGRVTITTSKGGITRTIEVSQNSKSAKLSVSPTSASIKGEGGSQTFTVTSNLGWKVVSSQSWLTVNQSEGTGDGTVTATAEANGTNGSRSATLTFRGTEGNPDPVTVTVSQEAGGISVSPTKASLLGAEGSTTNISVNAAGSWTLTGLPNWLHASATSGVGNTTIALTALSENWSDAARSAVLTFRTSASSTSATVSQEGNLPKNLRVTLSNTTIMSDGFACDLKFSSEAKGYKEAFFTASAIRTMTERDIYNKLMENSEYSSLANYACLPGWTDPETELVYCVAAFGNENNADGSHKYGPMTIEHFTTKAKTLYDDMHLSLSYNSSRWMVEASRVGSYGQKCDEYYSIGAEDETADDYYTYCNRFTYAMMAHLVFKPAIAAKADYCYYEYGPQTIRYNRTGDKFICTTWGIDRDTKEYSAELSYLYRDLSSSTTSSAPQRAKEKRNPSEWNKPYRHLSKAEINKLRQSLRVYKVRK